MRKTSLIYPLKKPSEYSVSYSIFLATILATSIGTLNIKVPITRDS
jgi:hypothetical protein